MSPAPPHRRAPGNWVGLMVAISVLTLVVAPTVSARDAGSTVTRPSGLAVVDGCGTSSGPTTVVANVTWNGIDLCAHSDVGSALSVDFTKTADVLFTWSSGATHPADVSDARLQMFYLGFSVATRDVTTTSGAQTNGTFPMAWNPGILTYVLAGVYRITASLLDPNGTTFWSENFYVTATAPYVIGAVLPIILLVLVLYELFALFTSGKQAGLGAKQPPAPPSEAPPPSPPPESGTSPPSPPGGPP